MECGVIHCMWSWNSDWITDRSLQVQCPFCLLKCMRHPSLVGGAKTRAYALPDKIRKITARLFYFIFVAYTIVFVVFIVKASHFASYFASYRAPYIASREQSAACEAQLWSKIPIVCWGDCLSVSSIVPSDLVSSADLTIVSGKLSISNDKPSRCGVLNQPPFLGGPWTIFLLWVGSHFYKYWFFNK